MHDSHYFLAPSPDIDVEYFKRAVLKPAPTCFTVEVLPPTKQGKAHSYGVRIIPINPLKLKQSENDQDDAQSVNSDSTVSSVGREYEIWRRWDDVLDFETKLEDEYSRMSREKKRGLRHPKKSSDNRGGTLYNNPNAAASFESLPEGPDPKNIKVDLHAYIPRITRKSSFFSANDATIQKRGEEFAAMVYGLFKADCPKLIEELRDSSTARDFFAWWRRDQELMEKQPKSKQQPKRPSSSAGSRPTPASIRSPSRASVDGGSSVFTSPPSPDSPGFSMKKRGGKEYVHPQRSPTETSSTSHAPPSTCNTTSSINTSSPHLRSDRSLPTPPMSPEQVGSANRNRSPMPLRTGRPNISRPMAHPQYGADSMGFLVSPDEIRRTNSPAAQNRMGRVFDSVPVRPARPVYGPSDASSDDSPPTTPVNHVRPSTVRPVSQCSIDSIDSVDYDIDLSFIRLEPAPRSGSKRDSVMSVDSVRTTNSMDGVLGGRALQRSSRVGSRSRRRRDGPWEPDSRLSYAVPEEDEAQFVEAQFVLAGGDDRDDFRDEFESAFDDSMSYLEHLNEFPEVPASEDGSSQYQDRRMSFPASVCESSFEGDFDMYSEPPSPTSTIHGPASSDSGHSTMTAIEPGMCAIKAKYDDVIVALRLPIGTPLSTLRARLTEKFAQVEGVQLHYRFSLAYAPPRRQSRVNMLSDAEAMPIILSPAAFGNIMQESNGRPQSIASTVFGAAQLTRLVPIWSQDDWEFALSSCNNKIVLHVLDQEVC